MSSPSNSTRNRLLNLAKASNRPFNELVQYEGIRISFKAKLEGEKNTIPMQIDCGFGDKATPAPKLISYPVLLDNPPPNLSGYPAETVVAEKLHTMVEKGQQNSRIKDYHDIWVLLRMNLVSEKTLPLAVERTFKQRGMTLDWDQVFQAIHLYGTSKNAHEFWSRYRSKGNYNTTPENIKDLCRDILENLSIFKELVANSP